MISHYYYSRSIKCLPLGWRETYKKYFSIFLPFEFKKMLSFAEIVKHRNKIMNLNAINEVQINERPSQVPTNAST